MKPIKHLLTALLFLLTFAQAHAVQYSILSNPQPTHSGKNIEVLEFFFYGCSHCYDLHPLLTEWEKKKPKDVNLTLVPTVFRPEWASMAYTFYALEAMGKQHQLHDPLYRAWNMEKNILSEESTATDFVGRNGVDSNAFSSNYHSFSVQSKVTRAQQMQQTYGIRGTPTLIVDGKYVITSLHPEDMISNLNAAIEAARKDRKGLR